jgi:endonuclease/exonuclease/phosphatase family metal-dependent hydrolase
MIRILTWNIGSFSFLKYAKYFGIKYKGHKILNEYFQPNINGVFVSKSIEKLNPDILFLQEFYHPKDVGSIEILKKYQYKKLIHTWYHKHSILIASKCKFMITEKNNFSLISMKDLNFIPIHLNSFYALKRLDDCLILRELSKDIPNLLILGDTNIWSRGDKFLFCNDKRAYSVITEHLLDFSKKILSTSYFGVGLDKVFVSKSLIIKDIKSPQIRSSYMDHYPIIVDLE